MKRIKAKCGSGILGGRSLGAQPAIGVDVIRRELRALQRKCRFIAPMATMSESAILGFSAIAATHNEELHRRFLVDAVFRAFEPMIEPAQSPVVECQCSLCRKFNFAGNISSLAAVGPR